MLYTYDDSAWENATPYHINSGKYFLWDPLPEFPNDAYWISVKRNDLLGNIYCRKKL